jgi:hypothetical protein
MARAWPREAATPFGRRATRSPADRTCPQARSTAGVFVKEVAGVESARHAPAFVFKARPFAGQVDGICDARTMNAGPIRGRGCHECEKWRSRPGLFRHRGQRRRRLNQVLSVWERLGWSHGKPGLALAALGHDLFRRSLPAGAWQWYWCLRPGLPLPTICGSDATPPPFASGRRCRRFRASAWRNGSVTAA